MRLEDTSLDQTRRNNARGHQDELRNACKTVVKKREATRADENFGSTKKAPPCVIRQNSIRK